MKMLWKEWRQQRFLFLLFCIVGISLPVFEVLESLVHRGKFFTNSGDGFVMVFGAFFAILLCAITTGLDVKKGVDGFLLSRPIKVSRLFVTKVLIASVLLFLVFLFSVSLDFLSDFLNNRDAYSSWTVVSYMWPLSIMFFCVTMFLMVVLRDTAKAVFVAIWFGILVYFLPLLIGSLGWMNLLEVADDFRNRPSVMGYLIDKCSMFFRAADPVVGSCGSGGVCLGVRKISFFDGLWMVIGSDKYLQYLLFVGFCGVVAIGSLVLAVVGFSRNWRWRPGQRTIVWGIGLSAAFIFSVSMFQAGANIEVIDQCKGKRIINPVHVGWYYMPGTFIEALPQGHRLVKDNSYFDSRWNRLCFKDDLMFRVSCGAEVKETEKYSLWDDELKRHFVVQAYKFPYAENNAVDEGKRKSPDFLVGVIRFYETEPVLRGRATQAVLGCFTVKDRLYICYWPRDKKDAGGNYPMQLNPIRLATVDISDPGNMRIVSNMIISNSGRYSGSMASYGEYCYINDGAKLIVVSVAKPDTPEIVNSIMYDDMADRTVLKGQHKNSILVPCRHFDVIGDKLICANSRQVSILELSKPLKPEIIYDKSFADRLFSGNIRAVTYKDDLLYLSTDEGLYCFKLLPMENGSYVSELIGQRKTTPIEKLAGRDPKQLFFYKNYLAETAWGMGVILYDVSNPARPKRAFCGQSRHFISDAGLWNGLLYIQGWGYDMTFLDIEQKR